MKSCPTCKRTYPDEPYVFCLEDGALLSAPHSAATQDRTEVMPAQAPPTQILKAPTTSPNQRPPLQSTIAAPSQQRPPLNQAQPVTSVAATTGAGYWMLRVTLVLRGLSTIVFSLAFYRLARSIYTFSGLLGSQLMIGGVLAGVASIGAYMEYKRGGRLLVDAIASLFSGLLIIALGFGSPHTLISIAFILIPIWAIIIGLAQIGAALHLRNLITGNKLLIATGVASLVFGVGVFAHLMYFGLALIIYGVTFGVLLIVLGVKLHGKAQPI